ncbi:hypothetical protein RXV95_00510 [Novosphingobium sp. ZN18A2]|uniref:hypothetical protein n=1 Tax=Novosphingobium sp. ZN18A2 TaxID=3079861 RepID=UPI0030CD478D
MRLFAALALAVIGLQAAQPWRLSVAPQHGSAFSASTVEVALVTERRGETARQTVVPEPIAGARTVPVRRPAVATAMQPRWRVRPESTGPPFPDLLLLRPGPRAPPA